jgi:hypothetical protein
MLEWSARLKSFSENNAFKRWSYDYKQVDAADNNTSPVYAAAGLAAHNLANLIVLTLVCKQAKRQSTVQRIIIRKQQCAGQTQTV